MPWNDATDAAILGAQQRAREEDTERLARQAADHEARIRNRGLAVIPAPMDAAATTEPSAAPGPTGGPPAQSWGRPGGVHDWGTPPPIDRARALRTHLQAWLEKLAEGDDAT